jgi:hypothetical protein
MKYQRVISPNNLPAKLPVAWLVVAYLCADKIAQPWAMVLFCVVLAVVSIAWFVKVMTEITVDVVDQAEIKEDIKKQSISN